MHFQVNISSYDFHCKNYSILTLELSTMVPKYSLTKLLSWLRTLILFLYCTPKMTVYMQVFKEFQFAFLFFCFFCFFVCHHECAGKAGNSRKQQFIKLIRPHQEDVKNIFCKVLINKILDETHFLQSWQWKLISSDSLLSRVCWELHPGVVFSITVDQSWSLLTAVTLESWRGI